MRKSIQIWDLFFPLVFPNNSENITSLNIGLREVGAKIRLNGVNKENKSVKKKVAAAILTIFEQKCSNLRPLLSKTFPQGFLISKKFGHLISRSGGKKTFKRYLKSEQMKKKIRKNFFCRGDFRPFLCKNVQIGDHFLPILFPKNSESLKFLDIQLWEVGAPNEKKISKKKTGFSGAILDHFWAKMFKSETTSFHYFSPRIPNL